MATAFYYKLAYSKGALKTFYCHSQPISLYCLPMAEEQEKEQFIQVPAERISPEALSAILDEFILREGTDYGHSDATLEDKRLKVQKQLSSGRAVIVYSTLTENTTLMLAGELAKLN